jgi:hypothetical protein
MSAPPILATILRADLITARGIEAGCVFALCRKLLAAGHDHRAPLVAEWCDGRHSMRISNLAAGARLAVRETASDGPRLVAWQPPPDARATVGGAPPVLETMPAGTTAHAVGAHA